MAGTTKQLAATGTYSDGSTKTITTSVTWISSNISAATISTGGLATGSGTGTTRITAALGNVSGAANLTVQLALTGCATPQTRLVTPRDQVSQFLEFG